MPKKLVRYLSDSESISTLLQWMVSIVLENASLWGKYKLTWTCYIAAIWLSEENRDLYEWRIGVIDYTGKEFISVSYFQRVSWTFLKKTFRNKTKWDLIHARSSLIFNWSNIQEFYFPYSRNRSKISLRNTLQAVFEKSFKTK